MPFLVGIQLRGRSIAAICENWSALRFIQILAKTVRTRSENGGEKVILVSDVVNIWSLVRYLIQSCIDSSVIPNTR